MWTEFWQWKIITFSITPLYNRSKTPINWDQKTYNKKFKKLGLQQVARSSKNGTERKPWRGDTGIYVGIWWPQHFISLCYLGILCSCTFVFDSLETQTSYGGKAKLVPLLPTNGSSSLSSWLVTYMLRWNWFCLKNLKILKEKAEWWFCSAGRAQWHNIKLRSHSFSSMSIDYPLIRESMT